LRHSRPYREGPRARPAARLSRLLGRGLQEDGLQGRLPAAGAPWPARLDQGRAVAAPAAGESARARAISKAWAPKVATFAALEGNSPPSCPGIHGACRFSSTSRRWAKGMLGDGGHGAPEIPRFRAFRGLGHFRARIQCFQAVALPFPAELRRPCGDARRRPKRDGSRDCRSGFSRLAFAAYAARSVPTHRLRATTVGSASTDRDNRRSFFP